MKDIENPFEKGREKLRNGDLPSAVLLFEAHVQQSPDSIEGWQYLGISQAHNEQDMAAVAALEKWENTIVILVIQIQYKMMDYIPSGAHEKKALF